MPDTEVAPVEDAAATEQEETTDRFGIEEALAQARETLAGGTLADLTDDDETEATEEEVVSGSDDDEEEAEETDEEDETDDDEESESEEDESAEADEEDSEEEDSEEETDDEQEEDPKFSAKLPGRGPDDPDIEIEVSDQATADRINHLRNGFMRGETVRAATVELQGAQEELNVIEDRFTTDPAGFVIDAIDEAQLPQVALGLLVNPGVWEKLSKTLGVLRDNPSELRTLQAEVKASRLETKEALRERAKSREADNKNAGELRDAIDLMIPEGMEDTRAESLRQDIRRDVVEHISRNKLERMEPKDLIAVVADRLELNGIDPLEARKAIKSGSRNGAKVSTRKRPKKKAKSGKQLVKASAKRKKIAAAPKSGRKAAPTDPKKLPAGQTIAERIATVKKQGGTGAVLANR